MTDAPDPLALYRSAAGQAALQAWYAAALARILTPTTSQMLATSVGPIQILRAGPDTGVPVLLLPTWAAHGPLLGPLLTGLARSRPVIAVDPPGHTGRSAATLLDPQQPAFVDWLGELLDQIGAPQADLVGHGYGAWQAIRAAALLPARVRRVALLGPAFFGSAGFGIIGQVAGIVLNPFASTDQKVRQFARGVLAPRGLPLTAELAQVVEWFVLLAKHARYPLTNPAPPAGWLLQPPVELIRQVRQPSLVLIGEHEVMYEPTAALRLARAALPGLVAAEQVDDAGHGLYFNQPTPVSARIAAFLDSI